MSVLLNSSMDRYPRRHAYIIVICTDEVQKRRTALEDCTCRLDRPVRQRQVGQFVPVARQEYIVIGGCDPSGEDKFNDEALAGLGKKKNTCGQTVEGVIG